MSEHVRENVITSYLNVERCIIDFFELRPVMELDLVPLSLIFVEIKVVHARLAYLIVGRTSLDNLSLVAVIQREVVVP
jgi:hypothetical protein